MDNQVSKETGKKWDKRDLKPMNVTNLNVEIKPKSPKFQTEVCS